MLTLILSNRHTSKALPTQSLEGKAQSSAPNPRALAYSGRGKPERSHKSGSLDKAARILDLVVKFVSPSKAALNSELLIFSLPQQQNAQNAAQTH